MKLSIVATMYRSREFIAEFYDRATLAAAQVSDDIEIVLVNDGSPDDSLHIARELAMRDERVVVVDLSRNFGHHQAMMAGLAHATGDRILLIDIDLEESPEWLADFGRIFDESHVDVAFGVQSARRGPLFKRLTGRAFYWVFNHVSETSIPADACTFRLMSRRYVNALLSLRDKSLFLGGNAAWVGFEQRPVTVEKRLRKSQSTYGIRQMLKMSIDAITSFTSYPLQALFFIGLLISAIAAVFGMVLIVDKLLNPNAVAMGWSSVMISIWFLGGTIIAALGVIGMYISRLFIETKPRPSYIVREVIQSKRRVGDGTLVENARQFA